MHGHGHGMHGHGQNPDVYGTPPQPQEPLQHGGCLVCRYAKKNSNLRAQVMSSQNFLKLIARKADDCSMFFFPFVCGRVFVEFNHKVIFDPTKG